MASGKIKVLHFLNILKYLKYGWNFADVLQLFKVFVLTYILASHFLLIRHS